VPPTAGLKRNDQCGKLSCQIYGTKLSPVVVKDKKQLFGPVVGAVIRIHKVPQATTRQKSSPTLEMCSLHLHNRSFFFPSVVKEYKGTFVSTAIWVLEWVDFVL
jgi:hypothetical protein